MRVVLAGFFVESKGLIMGAIGSVLGTVAWSALPDKWQKSVIGAAGSLFHGIPGFSITSASLPGYVLGAISLVLLAMLIGRYRAYERTHNVMRDPPAEKVGAPWNELMAQAVTEATEAGRRHRLTTAMDSMQAALNEQASLAKALHDQLRDANNELSNARTEIAGLKAAASPATLCGAVFRFVKELREKRDSVPDGLTQQQEFDLIWDDFQARFWDRFEVLKDRLRAVSPFGSVSFPSDVMPWTKDALTVIANKMEQEALAIRPDILE